MDLIQLNARPKREAILLPTEDRAGKEFTMSVVHLLSRADQPADAAPPQVPAAAVVDAGGLMGKHPAEAEAASEPYPLDRAFHAALARFTGGISPVALSLAWLDWSSHLAAAPQRQMEIARNVIRDTGSLLEASVHAMLPEQKPWSVVKPQARDRRFKEPQWEAAPFNLLAQAFLLGERWWQDATTGTRGVLRAVQAHLQN
jgi:polyhydroxyalkanoate synthase